MQLEDYFDFLGPDAIRIKGHRIGIEHVLAYYQEGGEKQERHSFAASLPVRI